MDRRGVLWGAIILTGMSSNMPKMRGDSADDSLKVAPSDTASGWPGLGHNAGCSAGAALALKTLRLLLTPWMWAAWWEHADRV